MASRPGLVELAAALELVVELVAGAAAAGAGRVAALDHEVGDDAVEDGAVVERAPLRSGCARVRPLLLPVASPTKFATVFGASLLKSLTTMTPLLVSKTTKS